MTQAQMTTTALAAYAAAVGADTPQAYIEAAHALATALEALATAKAPRARAARQATPAGVIAAALQPVVAVVARRNPIPILSNVRVQSDGVRVTFTATDVDRRITRTVPAYGFEACDITVPASNLIGALKGVKGDVAFKDVSFAGVPQIDAETGLQAMKPPADWDKTGKASRLWIEQPYTRAVITAGGVEHTLPGLPSDDFPVMAAVDYPAIVSIPGPALVESLAAVWASVSTEETRYYLNGAYLHTVTEQGRQILRVVATDGHRLTCEDIEGGEVEGDLPGVIIPREGLAWIIKHAGAGPVLTEAAAKGIRLTCDAGEMVAKVVDGSFPDYMRVIPQATWDGAVVTLDTSAAMPVLRRLAAGSNAKHASVRLTACAGMVEGLVRDHEGQCLKGDVPTLACEGEAVLGFNAGFLIDALALGERATLHLGAENGPVRVSYEGRPGRVGVLMPLRA